MYGFLILVLILQLIKKVIKKENELGKTKICFRFKYSLLSCYRMIDRIVNDKKRW